ncbi:23880_t:CDS:2 [Dentiscutata erythropus]|uniref:23880_t:CDS:1 n=1 Tax=Dentiscutata erythropus TaxID=1348616 RepID=A0A9N9CER7_9GLOM|nr:23880_t:CDS:2 [Dentiscutata erythropus]
MEMITDFQLQVEVDKPITPPQLTKMVALTSNNENINDNTAMEMTTDFQLQVEVDKPVTQTPPQLRSTNNDENINDNTATEMTTDFQLQVIKSAVDECLQEFRTSIRNDIQNMHLELLRQFHIQKTEMEMMFLKYCGETLSLREELERLREENERLKMKL